MSAARVLNYPPMPTAEDRVWISKDALIAKTGVHPRTIERHASGGLVISRPLAERGRNGRPLREYRVETLPAELRAKLAPLKPRLEMMRPAGPSQDSAPLFPVAVSEQPSQRISLSPEAERQATERLGIIQPLLDFADPANRPRYAALQLQDGRRVGNSNLLSEYIAETRTIGGKTFRPRILWDWVKRYREGGLPALARKTRSDSGTSSFFTRYPAAAQLAAAEYHKPYATVARAYDAIVRDQELLRIPTDEMPTSETVRCYLKSLPKPMVTLAREGQRAWNDQHAPHVSRGYTDIPVAAFYVADHMIHDCEVRNDCFPGVPQDAPMRLRLTAIMDLRSRKMVGYCWAAEGDSRSIVTALRRAVQRYGPCHTFYCDNGQDFKKVASGAICTQPSKQSIREGHDEIVRRGALQQLGCKVQFCLPYHAQSKPIEKAFRFVHARLDGIMHTYLTGNSYNRPDAATLAGAQHRRLVKFGRGEESTLMPASIFIKLAETWIEQDYNALHKHSGRGMDKRTPNEVFDAGYPAESRRRADPAVLDQLLFERRTVKVLRTAVTIDKRRYMPAGSDSDSYIALYHQNGRQVVVAYDPLDPDHAILLDDRGCKVADLQAEILTTHTLSSTPETREPISQMSKVRGRLLKASSLTIATMHQEVAMSGHKSAIEHLADRALVTMPVGDLVSRKVTRAVPDATAPRSPRQVAQDLYRQQQENQA